MMDIGSKYPSLPYLERAARRRIPYFAWEYLSSGTGTESLVGDNRTALDRIKLVPGVLAGDFQPDTSTHLFGRKHALPFGPGPVGMSGLVWPGAEIALARASRDNQTPYCLSIVANETPETIGSVAGEDGWFQLYAPSNPEILNDLLARAWASGMRTLVLTVDVPVGSRRERQLAAGLTMPVRMDARTLLRVAGRPRWALEVLRRGKPELKTIAPYLENSGPVDGARLLASVLNGRPDWDFIRDLRDRWQGNLVIKGIVSPEAAAQCIDCGADGIVVSNHGGRQFDGAPAAIDCLPPIAERVAGRIPVLFDSGLRGGLDIIRALSQGADFCLLGRGFLFAMGALGDRGAGHAFDILRADLENNMIQLGAKDLVTLRGMANQDR